MGVHVMHGCGEASKMLSKKHRVSVKYYLFLLFSSRNWVIFIRCLVKVCVFICVVSLKNMRIILRFNSFLKETQQDAMK